MLQLFKAIWTIIAFPFVLIYILFFDKKTKNGNSETSSNQRYTIDELDQAAMRALKKNEEEKKFQYSIEDYSGEELVIRKRALLELKDSMDKYKLKPNKSNLERLQKNTDIVKRLLIIKPSNRKYAIGDYSGNELAKRKLALAALEELLVIAQKNPTKYNLHMLQTHTEQYERLLNIKPSVSQ